MKNVEDYKKRSTCGFNRPIEFNHKGDKINIVHVHERYLICPLGPNQLARCEVLVLEINEDEETITVSDEHRKLTMSFDDWTHAKPQYIG